MFRIQGSLFSSNCLAALVIAAASGVYSTACVAQEPAPAIGASQAVAASALAADGDQEENNFPLPIWKNKILDDPNSLGGVLLHSADGPVQIKELLWGANEEGFINICYVEGFTAEGDPVVFGSTNGCLAQVTKDNFLGSAMTQSDKFIESFEFVTCYQGYLAVGNPVIGTASPSGPAEPCALKRIKHYRKEGCTGTCGEPVDVFLSSPTTGGPGGIGPAIDPDVNPLLLLAEDINCECLGNSGTCVLQWIEECAGTCLPGLSCLPEEDEDGNPVCECR